VEYQYDPATFSLTLLRGAGASDNEIIVFD
jgi:hypothetical protein